MISNKLIAILAALFFSLMGLQDASCKPAPEAIWQRLADLEKNNKYATIRVENKIDMSNADVKKHYGEPDAIEHYQLMHPATTGTIWRYKRANGVLEFRFFNSTKHVHQIELKSAKAQPQAK